MQDYSYDYLWQNPKLYKRLTYDDIKSYDGTLSLCEAILKDIHKDVSVLRRAYSMNPSDKNTRANAMTLISQLESPAISAMSFGGSSQIAKELRKLFSI